MDFEDDETNKNAKVLNQFLEIMMNDTRQYDIATLRVDFMNKAMS